MGSGTSQATPTILRAFRRETTIHPKSTTNPTDLTEKSLELKYKNGTKSETSGKNEIAAQDQNDKESVLEDEEFIKIDDAFNKSPWPYHNLMKLGHNVNSKHGGSASLVFISCSYGGKGEDTNTDAHFIRGGFDCNHCFHKQFFTDHEVHGFGAENMFSTDEKGQLVIEGLFGTNHVRVFSNDSRFCNLRDGVYVQGDNDETCIPLDVNGMRDGITGSGLTMILCSGVMENQTIHAVYMVRSGFKDNKFSSKLLIGEDKYIFSTDSNGILRVKGPKTAKFGLFHNRSNLFNGRQHAFVSQTQSIDGKAGTVLCENVGRDSTCIVLCSTSSGTEDRTAAAVYCVMVENEAVKSAKEIAGSFSKPFTASDLWRFEIQKGQLMVFGADGPNRYGLMTNISATVQELRSSLQQNCCLATGESTRTVGKVQVTGEEVTGEVNKRCPIHVMLNHKTVKIIDESKLKAAGSRFSFAYRWAKEEKTIGYHLVKVFAARPHTLSGEPMFLELTGSPHGVTRQKAGVLYALNVGGPVYQAHNDIVYSSEFGQYANFSPDVNGGFTFTCFGIVKVNTKLPISMLRSLDGFLCSKFRAPLSNGHNSPGSIVYKVPGIPNGDYTFRLHADRSPSDIVLNGTQVSNQMQMIHANQKLVTDIVDFTCYQMDVPVKVTSGQLEIKTTMLFNNTSQVEKISAFALLDPAKYVEKSLAANQIAETERQKLMDEVSPLKNSVTRKQMTIVGWSPNLLMNSSAELGNFKHWNTSGDFKIEAGGYETEQCFITTYSWCQKYQEVSLLEHFDAKYLDTSPEIQVSEWYKEGYCGGGFYEMKVELLSENGEVLAEYSTGQIGSVYKDKQWQHACHTFSGYGPGVRIVGFSSQGKDDKFWAGHFGTVISGATVRVKRQSKPAEGDKYEDVMQGDGQGDKGAIDKLITQIIKDNSDLVKSFFEEENLPLDEKFERQTMTNGTSVQKPCLTKTHQKRTKREIRVFVSSTFRDFTKEREEIIKKAFREINRLCSERGVFFTYVDLRWGITSEQTNDGKTIAICLQEIERCRPYFICLMGERFGWCQMADKKDDVLDMTFNYAIEHHPSLKWIEKYRYDTSVTQLEVLHGVLNSLQKDKSFFYIREPVSRESVSEDMYMTMSAESDWHEERQQKLKALVLEQKSDVKIRNFRDHKEVAELIKQDLAQIIEADFPKGTELSKLEQQQEAHHAFASARCRVYIGRKEYFEAINEARTIGVKQPFVLLGESGSGKSALVANWAKQVEESEPETFLFLHFIGCSSDSANYLKLLRRLYEELKTSFKFDMEIPSSDSQLINELSKWLRMAGALTRVVLVFDALNQMDDGSGDQEGPEHDLLWIPQELPPNVFLLVSTLPGEAMKACERFGWPSMRVQPLEGSQKGQIISDYLEGIYGKTLTQDQKDLIVNAEQTSNALYLKSLLDEVRMYGSFRTLTSKIQDYLTAGNPGDLFAKILSRHEADFESGENARKNLVRDATSGIWCSNRGMSEAELTELLDVKSALWSPFYLSLYENLINRDGILNFCHDHLRQAVEKKYLATAEAKRLAYLKLADYYSKQETNHRTVEELPFLLAKAGEKERLKATVSDLQVFHILSASENGIFELVKAWRFLGDFTLAAEAYLEKLDKIPMEEQFQQFEYYCSIYGRLGSFFLTLGLIRPAQSVYEILIGELEHVYGKSHGTIVYSSHSQSYKYCCKHPAVIQALQDLGQVHFKLGNLDQAIEIYSDAINRQNRIETAAEKQQLCEGLVGVASVEVAKANMAVAKKLLTRALELATDLLGKRHHFVAAIFTRLGQLSYKQGRIDEAQAYFLQDLKVTRSEVGSSHPRTAIVLNEIALVYDDKSEKLAGELYEAALQIYMDTYGNNYIGTGIIRYNLGAYYFGANYFSRACFQFEESYRVLKSFLGDEHEDTMAACEALQNLRAML